MPFKAEAACRRHIPKQQHRVTNWAEYDAGLRARGSLTVWFTPEAVAAWAAAPRTSRGGQASYSGEVPPGAEALRRRYQGGDRSRCDRADAGDRHEPPRDGVGLGTPGNLTIQLLELLFQGIERSDQHLQDPAGALGYRRFRVFDQRD
jgi:hypothetical protein